MNRTGLTIALIVLAVSGLSCKSEPKSPLAAKMVEINQQWTKLQAEGTPGIATQLAAMFRDEAITGSEPYTANEDFRNFNNKAIEGLERLETNIGERSGFDIAISQKQVSTACANCHRRYWSR